MNQQLPNGYDLIRDQAALAVLLTAMTIPGGRQGRFRLSVNDAYPKPVFYIPAEGEVGSTSLRDFRQTGMETVKVCVPRQPGCQIDSPLQPGPIFEPDIGSGRWYEITEVSYCCSTPTASPMYTFTLTYTGQDTQPTT